jgi:Phage capsid family
MKHESESAFRREPRDLPAPGNLCTRALTARTLASLHRRDAEDIVAEMWPNDRALAQMITRAASAPAMTSVAGWAAELVRRKVADTVAALGAASSAADVMAKGLLLDWDGTGIISAPGFVASAANSGFVQEGQPIPVRQLAVGPALLNPYKLATIAALTREMVESSNAEVLISDALVRSTGLALDAVFFSTNAATAAAPAGIRNGIATSTASVSTDPFGAFFEDMATLLNAIGPVGGKGPYFLVGSVGRIASASARFGSLKAEGDNATFIPVAATAVGNDIIAIAPQGIVAALSADPDVETTNAGTLVMDTAPGAAGTTGTGEKEMFQTDSIALKVRWPASWALRDSRAVAWLTPAWK